MIARDLRKALDRARVPGPYVLVGHSSGAQYVRVFTGLYPGEVAGMVLLDGQPAEAFTGLPAFPAFYTIFHRVYAVLPSLARVGVGRIISSDDPSLPASARALARVTHSSARHYRSVRDEFEALPRALEEAGALRSLGARPLVVVTATVDPLTGWLPLQEKLAALSTHSRHRLVPYTHDALVSDERGSLVSSEAIRDVVAAVRSGASLNHSF
jgi:pimeloyl-ACP methyl ester carboxylesterase